jgi:hypothetical protein
MSPLQQFGDLDWVAREIRLMVITGQSRMWYWWTSGNIPVLSDTASRQHGASELAYPAPTFASL